MGDFPKFSHIYKGHDCIKLEFEVTLNHDEIHTFLDVRYVSAPEAAWRLFEFPMHHHSHTIVRLAIYLQNQQNVYFTQDQEKAALFNASKCDTHLTAWFKLNETDVDARHLLYSDTPSHFTLIVHLASGRNVAGR